MIQKIFSAEQFIPTQQKSSGDKAKFANHFARFIQKGFKKTLFYNWFYKQLCNTFGHIAHFDKIRFFQYFFTTPQRQLSFLQWTLNYQPTGDPAFTFSDVETAIQKWLLKSGFVEKITKIANNDTQLYELKMRNFLLNKYPLDKYPLA